ncbi:MAG: protein-L-isoaspartate O-methyltransferase [Rhizobiaceae bacterium]|nr:protein-L-isoaspartate O-methyltransferase [Rhizobiaceae bacterium]
MINLQSAREQMVDCQVRTNDITEHALISALLDVPRERFLPESMMELAYTDCEFSFDKLGASNRFLMAPATLASMIEAADVEQDDVALVIGAATGYSSAVLSLLTSSVMAIESDPKLAEFASNALSENGFDNVAVMNRDLAVGCEKEAPFDVILIEGAVEEIPSALMQQLADNGRLVAVVGTGLSGTLQLVKRVGGQYSQRTLSNHAAKPLPGFAIEEKFSL